MEKSNLYYRYTAQNLERMEKGLAPQRFNREKGKWESMELEHDTSKKEKDMFDFVETWPKNYTVIDQYRHSEGRNDSF